METRFSVAEIVLWVLSAAQLVAHSEISAIQIADCSTPVSAPDGPGSRHTPVGSRRRQTTQTRSLLRVSAGQDSCSLCPPFQMWRVVRPPRYEALDATSSGRT